MLFVARWSDRTRSQSSLCFFQTTANTVLSVKLAVELRQDPRPMPVQHGLNGHPSDGTGQGRADRRGPVITALVHLLGQAVSISGLPEP